MPITSAIHGWCVSSTIAIFFSFLPFICLLPFAAATDTLNSSQPLRDGETLVSANNLFELGFFNSGQSQNRYVGIRYSGFGLSSRFVWVANRESPLANFNGSLVIDNGGNLVVLDGSSNIQWSSSSPAANTATTVGFIAVLQDSGNLVLREGNSTYSGRVVWESFDDPTDTLLPGMKIGINLTTGKTQMLRSWKSDDDPAPGSFSFGIDPQAPNQFFVWRRSAPFWRVIFWNGSSFDSPPWMASRFNYSVTRKEEEIYFTYPFLPTPVREVMGLAVKSNGDLNTYSAKISVEETYNLDWSRPDPVCYPSGNCGPNSSCNENINPICKCLPGFMPVSVTDWNSGKWQDGCTPRTKLQCGAQDGFLQLKRVKLVDPNNFASAAENATECRQFCDDIGCRCSAYAFKINGSSFSCSIWNSTSTLGTDDYQLNIREEDDDESLVLDVNVRVPASEFNLTGRRCESCGTNTIPYPLSTGPNCGDPAYNSFKCDDFGQLRFQGPNDSSFAITSINPETRTFVIKPEGVDLCWAGSSKRSDIHLNGSLPFHVSKNNTILLLNCSSTPKNLSPLNCESSSPCHIYIQKGRAPCFHSEMCCSHVAGGSQSSTSHKVGISDTGCNAYASIVNLNSSVEVSMWHEGVEIEWDGPPEPVCESSKDCDAWPNSSCLSDKEVVGRKRCFCNGNLQWDPLHMNCTHVSTEGSDRSGGKKGNKRLLIIITTTTAAIGILLSVTLIYCLWRRKNKRKGKKLWNMSLRRLGASFHGYELLDRKNGLDIPFIDFKCIVGATENFSDSNKLGKGGFGPVYKGKLPGGQEIAVKRLSKNSGQGQEEFKNEVLLISKLQHMNLVKMLGYCIEGDEKMLIYEYMPNKSLDFFLFDPNRCALLDWKKRFNIILGIARGLLYLHQDSRLRIIHRDLKTSNILLDSEMNPKISDFGMARIFGRNQAEENTNRVVGTFGYISPEYAADGLFSVKSDVFSFGIVLLEIVCGKKNARYSNNEDTSSLTGHAWKLWKEEKGLDFMDPSLSDTYNPSEVLKCIHVGLLCVQENARDRPNMASVLNILDSETATLSSPKQPAFYIGSIPTANSASNSQMSCSKNEVTISTLEGR